MRMPLDDEWIRNGLIVLGGLGSLVAVGGFLLQDLVLLLAFVAGAGWVLSIALLVMVRRTTDELKNKETDLNEYRRQVGEWKTQAQNTSDSLTRFVAHAFEMPRVQPRRAQPQASPAATDDEDTPE